MSFFSPINLQKYNKLRLFQSFGFETGATCSAIRLLIEQVLQFLVNEPALEGREIAVCWRKLSKNGGPGQA
jgi:hypothetical protein